VDIAAAINAAVAAVVTAVTLLYTLGLPFAFIAHQTQLQHNTAILQTQHSSIALVLHSSTAELLLSL
jgi:hypothetical protein